MKVLIAYDGSRSAEAALDDLPRGGLTETVEAQIVSVAEVWMPPPLNGDEPEDYLSKASPEWLKKHDEAAEKSLIEAETLARHARRMLQIKFPEWKISAKSVCGSAARQILDIADELKPDLIVVGSQGRSAISRILLGSVSSKILSEAKCSVRVARGRVEVDPVPARIVIGFDGSPGAMLAIDRIISRRWREQCEFCLVSAINSVAPANIERFVPAVSGMFEEEKRNEKIWVEKLAETALRKMRSAGLSAELRVDMGNPKEVLIIEAEQWSADAIFLGSHSFSGKIERFLIGSVSKAIAERALCTVEVAR